MKFELREIAEIQMGYSYRTKLINRKLGNISVVQMKDLTDTGAIDTGNLVRTIHNKPDPRSFLLKNDIVFRSRGQNNSAAMIADNIRDTVLAAPLFRIRIKRDSIIPGYVFWFINLPQTQAWLSSRREGSRGGMISKKSLEELEINIPSMETQTKILEFTYLQNKAEAITKKLLALKKNYYSNLLLNAAKGDRF